uniref:Uncharacterized protein n=1 Tax=Panagrolaimus superbus TaxID=310955 RepID=A0A914YCD5_9BILA
MSKFFSCCLYVNGSQYLNSLLGEAFASGDFSEVLNDPDKPKAWETWIIGLAIVTVSAISAPLGMLIIPCLSKSLYDRFMTFLIALGVGAMSGSVMFILIPSAFTLTTLPNNLKGVDQINERFMLQHFAP